MSNGNPPRTTLTIFTSVAASVSAAVIVGLLGYFIGQYGNTARQDVRLNELEKQIVEVRTKDLASLHGSVQTLNASLNQYVVQINNSTNEIANSRHVLDEIRPFVQKHDTELEKNDLEMSQVRQNIHHVEAIVEKHDAQNILAAKQMDNLMSHFDALAESVTKIRERLGSAKE